VSSERQTREEKEKLYREREKNRNTDLQRSESGNRYIKAVGRDRLGKKSGEGKINGIILK